MTLSLQEWRDVVGPDADGMTDAELEALRDDYYRLARALVSNYIASRRPADDIGLQQVDQPRRPRRARVMRRSA